MMTGIQSSTSVASYSAASYIAATEEEEESTSTSSASVATTQTSETYTPSAEAMAYMAAEIADTESEAVTDGDSDVEVDADQDVDSDDVVSGDTTTDDAVSGDTTTDSDTTVDGSGDVEEEEEVEAEEEDDGLPSYSDYGDTDWTSLSGSEAKLMLMTSQMNTFSTMLNALNSDSTSERLSSLMNESWINDSSTFSYAGRYLAKSAAGEHGVQLNNQAEAEEEASSGIEYNNFSMDGHVSSDAEESE